MAKKSKTAKKDEVVLRYKRVLYPRALAMAGLVAAVAALAFWQRDFVMSGVSANPYLNLTIFAGMAFGVALTFSHLFEMRDDFKALDGLYEALDDARGEEAVNPVIREAARQRRDERLKQPAVLFRPPKLLGSGYLLLSQEIAGRGLLSVSNSTKKLLIEEIEERVDVRSNFTGYVGGMMVMLGLLGTFIGLMETVASVGTIISELDLSDSAGSGAIQNLISNLRAPLNGMATGFSSSLFGLIASLTIGILGRIVGSVHHTMRLDFEHWLNQVARIEQEDGSTPDRPTPAMAVQAPATGGDADFANALQAGEEQLLWRAVRSSIVAQSGLRDRIGELVEHVKADRFARQAEMDIVRGILQRSAQATDRQTALLEAILTQQGGAVPSPARRKEDKAADVTMQDWIDATAPSDKAEGRKTA